MTINMNIDVIDDMYAYNPCLHKVVSNDLNIFNLLIISIQPIFNIQSTFNFLPIF
jgi:hypothetical protein